MSPAARTHHKLVSNILLALLVSVLLAACSDSGGDLADGPDDDATPTEDATDGSPEKSDLSGDPVLTDEEVASLTAEVSPDTFDIEVSGEYFPAIDPNNPGASNEEVAMSRSVEVSTEVVDIVPTRSDTKCYLADAASTSPTNGMLLVFEATIVVQQTGDDVYLTTSADQSTAEPPTLEGTAALANRIGTPRRDGDALDPVDEKNRSTFHWFGCFEVERGFDSGEFLFNSLSDPAMWNPHLSGLTLDKDIPSLTITVNEG